MGSGTEVELNNITDVNLQKSKKFPTAKNSELLFPK